MKRALEDVFWGFVFAVTTAAILVVWGVYKMLNQLPCIRKRK